MLHHVAGRKISACASVITGLMVARDWPGVRSGAMLHHVAGRKISACASVITGLMVARLPVETVGLNGALTVSRMAALIAPRLRPPPPCL